MLQPLPDRATVVDVGLRHPRGSLDSKYDSGRRYLMYANHDSIVNYNWRAIQTANLLAQRLATVG